MALELASTSVIFHQKLTDIDQIIDLVPSRVLGAAPSPSKYSRCWAGLEGGMEEHPAGHRVDDLVVLLEFLMENNIFGC